MRSGQEAADLGKTRELVMRHGWNATAYQIVNPGISLWFPPADDAVVGYVTTHGRRVVAGAPVCSKQRLASMVAEWTDASTTRVCYFGAAGRIRELLMNGHGYSSVVLGAQPVWNPQAWRPERVPSLRQQFNRARNKGVRVEEWQPERASGHPALQSVLHEWLETRGLPPLHFLVEPETLAFLEGRRIFVAIQSGCSQANSAAEENVVAFLVLSPIPMRNGWLTEQFPRRKTAPNGTVELLVDAAARAVANDGATYLTMGLVPLSTQAASEDDPPNPIWLRMISRWVRAHGRRFYNFGGLEAFKAKFRPDSWEPIYVISNERRFSMRTLYAIAAAFTRTSPMLAILKGFGKAIRQELRWLTRHRA